MATGFRLHRPVVNPGVPDPVLKYFLARWAELCSPTTPVTVSAPSVSTRVAVRELYALERAKLQSARIRMDSSALGEEALVLIGNDPVIGTLDVATQVACGAEALRDSLSRGTESARGVDARDERADRTARGAWAQTARLCSVLLHMLEEAGYREAAIAAIEDQLDATGGNVLTRCQRMDPLLVCLASEALAGGFDGHFLARRAAVYQERTAEARAARFFSRLLHTDNDYDVYFRVRGAERSDHYATRTHEISVSTEPPATHDPAARQFMALDGALKLCVKVHAADELSAAAAGYRKVRDACAIAALWGGAVPAHPELRCLVRCPELQTERMVAVRSSATHYPVFPRHRMGELLDQALDDRRLTEAASLATSAATELVPDTRLLLLWMAAEHLVGDLGSERAADRVAGAFAPIIARRAPQRSVFAVSYRFGRLPGAQQRQLDAALLPAPSREAAREVERQDALLQALRADDAAVLDPLTEILKASDVVGYVRLNELRKGVAGAGWQAWRRARIEASHDRVRLQIQRLGRRRNLLIHSGSHVVDLECLRHLEFYLGQVFEAVLETKDTKDWEVETAFALERVLYDGETKK